MNFYILNGWHYRSATAAVASLIDGYTNILDGDEQAALIARYEAAVRFASGLQMDHLLQATPGTELSGYELETLDLDKHCTPACEVWQSPVALVLVRTDYEPFTEQPAPDGNVVWINPATELTLLQTLASAGVIKFRVG